MRHQYTQKICSVEGCGSTFNVQAGMCNKHYLRDYRLRNPELAAKVNPKIEVLCDLCGALWRQYKFRYNGIPTCKPCIIARDNVVCKYATVPELAWVAGLFDGEGSVNIAYRKYRSKDRNLSTVGAWVIRTRLSNTHLGGIQELKRIVGPIGAVSIRKEHGSSRLSYSWAIESRSGYQFLKSICPYTVIKREQIEIALAAYDFLRSSPRLSVGITRGGNIVTDSTNQKMRAMSDAVKALNGHKPMALEV